MPTFDHLQSSFAGGEISPRLWGRLDAEVYKKALARCRNLIPLPFGGVLLRQGTRYVTALGAADTVRLVQYRSALGADAVLVLTPGSLQIFSEGGQGALPGPVMLGQTQYVTNGDFSAGSYDWTLTGSGYIQGGAAYCGQINSVTTDGITTDYYENGTWAQSFNVNAGAYTFSFTFAALPRGMELVGGLTVKVGTAAGGADVLAQQVLATPGTTYQYTLTLAAAATVYITFGCNQTKNPQTDIVDVSGNGPAVPGAAGVSFVGAGGTAASAATPWGATDIWDVQTTFQPNGSGDQVVFTHSKYAPQVLTHAADGSWTFGPAALVNPPADWTGSNWPACCEIFQGRLFLAATPAAKNQIWASRSGTLFDFSYYTDTSNYGHVASAGPASSTVQVTDDCAFTEKIATKGAIRWLCGQRVLLAGTDDGEYSFTGAGNAITGQGGVLTPSDFHARQESAFGCTGRQPVMSGAQVLYVSADSQRVRATNFSLQTDGWESAEVSFPGEHFGRVGVQFLAWAREPYQTLLLQLADGTLGCCSYDAAQQLDAWFGFDVGGRVLSAVVENTIDGCVVWLAVARQTGTYLETLAMYEPQKPTYLDAAQVLQLTAGQTVVTGLAPYASQLVTAIIDGEVYPGLTVDASGSLTLPAAGVELVVGFAQPLPTAVTLPPEGGNPRGTAQRAKRRWVKAGLLLNDSGIPCVNGQRIAPDRSPGTALDTLEPRVTGAVEFDVTSAWEDRGQLTITVPDPVRTEILALYGSVAVSEV